MNIYIYILKSFPKQWKSSKDILSLPPLPFPLSLSSSEVIFKAAYHNSGTFAWQLMTQY